MEPARHHVLGLTANRGFHRIHYLEWGDPRNARVLVCVHGLTRNGRDFDVLASALTGRYRVLCPDIAGRGDSDWIAESDYGYPQYCADMAALIARSGAEQVDWVGTSMGGIIGMLLAAQPRSPIRRLLLNDVGPFIPQAAIEAIFENLKEEPVFDNVGAAAEYLARVNAGFGRLSRAQWVSLAETTVRRREDGKYVWKRDPAIAKALLAQPAADVVLWPIWERVKAPTMVLRGAESDLLPAAVAEEMTRRGPKARLETIPEAGHAPALRDPSQIALVRDFLTAPGP
jgi:pimeloyl-ACP methyl ester carboxylesterase